MRVIDLSPQNNDDSPHKLEDRIFRFLAYSSDTDKDLQAEEVLVTQVRKLLDDRYSMVRSFVVPGIDITIPFVLVGPSGVQVINVSGLTGVYRIKHDIWEEMSDDGQKFTSARPNIVARTLLMAKLVEDYLENEVLLSVEPTIFFSQHGIDVESDESAVRVILIDSLEDFISELIQDDAVLDNNGIKRVLDILGRTSRGNNEAAQITSIDRKKHALVGFGKLRLYYWQWIVLGMLVLIQILLLIGFVILVMTTN